MREGSPNLITSSSVAKNTRRRKQAIKLDGLNDTADLFPMIEVPNPNVAAGVPRTMLVYRTWTLEDIKKAVEGIPHPKGYPEGLINGMDLLRGSYHPNGVEMQQVLMTKLGIDWGRVQGVWNLMEDTNPGQLLAHDDQQLTARLAVLWVNVRREFKQRADYTIINQTKQKIGEPSLSID
ncbi:hypothetical protein GOODEAATRI_032103 [Goodea atripinnis]|uniref:Tail assembly chaperone n=1 Tax=Goodea atripinnis TaxID=208336 RepID=A0ABV0Q394_9TELE